MNRRALLLTLLSASLAGCASMQPRNVSDVIAADPNLSTLNSLVRDAGLADTLASAGPFTVFAPSNEAFKAVPAKTMGDLAANKEMLKSVLTYHVLSEKATTEQLKQGSVKTVNGASLAVSRAGTFVTVEDAMVVREDKSAANGVVLVIDRVLLPPKR